MSPIDLLFKVFCYQGKEPLRYDLKQPFVLGGYLCATDGRRAIRRKSDPGDTPGVLVPPVNNLFEKFDGYADAEPVGFLETLDVSDDPQAHSDQRNPARRLVKIGAGHFNPDLVAELIWCGAKFRAHPSDRNSPCHAVLPDGTEAAVMPMHCSNPGWFYLQERQP